MNELQCVFPIREKVTNRTLTLDNVIKTELYHEIRQISIVETIINNEGTVIITYFLSHPFCGIYSPTFRVNNLNFNDRVV